MGVWRDFVNRIRRLFNSTTVTQKDRELADWLGINTTGNKLSESTYFTCLKMLSETLGKLPIKYYRRTDKGTEVADMDDMARLMNVRPNPIMTPTTLWTAAELNCEHSGNAYIWIQRHFSPGTVYGGKVVNDGLWLLPSSDVSVVMDDAGIFGGTGKLYYRYTDAKTGKQYVFPQDDILHFKTSYTFDGIIGIPVREAIGKMIDSAYDSQKYMADLYKQGLTGPMALEYTSDLDQARVNKLTQRYQEYLTGARQSGQIIPVPLGLKLSPLKMSLSESQFYELRKYSALQIAAAFGIKPQQLNDLDKASYASSDAQQLAFLVDTMSYRIKGYEEEINYKCLSDRQIEEGYFFRFNEKSLLRTDQKTQMEVIKGAVNNGIYTANEARELLMLPAKEGGDILMVNGNYIPITMVKEKEKGGESN